MLGVNFGHHREAFICLDNALYHELRDGQLSDHTVNTVCKHKACNIMICKTKTLLPISH